MKEYYKLNVHNAHQFEMKVRKAWKEVINLKIEQRPKLDILS